MLTSAIWSQLLEKEIDELVRFQARRDILGFGVLEEQSALQIDVVKVLPLLRMFIVELWRLDFL